MKKQTFLSLVAAAALLVSGTSVCAEEIIVPEPGDEGIHQYLPTEEVEVDGAIEPSNEATTYTTYGYLATAGAQGVSIGQLAGYYDSSYDGDFNTNVGGYAGNNNREGDYNVYVGMRAGYSLYSYGSQNVGIGYYARYMHAGSNNTSIGFYSGYNNNGNQNVQLGTYSGYSTGSNNTQIGYAAGQVADGTDYSVMVGYNAGGDADGADYSVFIGYNAGYNMDRADTLMIENSNSGTPLIYGEFDNDLVRINGTFETSLSEESDANNKNIVALDRNNTGSGGSDVGFSLENIESDFKWTFRTYNPSEGFAVSKIGTGGTEFEVGNTGTDLSTTVVKMGGVVVFENGHLVNKSGDELTSLVQEQRVKIAAMESEIAELKTMKQKVAMMESILTNLALNSSDTDKAKVSISLK